MPRNAPSLPAPAAVLCGPAGRVPPRVVTNDELAERLDTGAASIPLALADAAARRTIRSGDRLLLTAFGGGLTWGSCLLTWPELPPTACPYDP